MASRLLFLTALIFFFCLAQVSSDIEGGDEATGSNPLSYIDCGGLCNVRCSQHSHPNRCKRACGACCSRCKCVPPGTYGNKEACGSCYTDMTTRGNKPKCP